MNGQGITLFQTKLQAKLPTFNPANIIAIIQAIMSLFGVCPSPAPTPTPPAASTLKRRFGSVARLALRIHSESEGTISLADSFAGAQAAYAVSDESTDAEKAEFLADMA